MEDPAKSRETDALLEEALVAAAQEVVHIRAEAETRVAALSAELSNARATLAEAERQVRAQGEELSALRSELEARPPQRLESLLDQLRQQEQKTHEQAEAHVRALSLSEAEAKRALVDLQEEHAELARNHALLLSQVESLEERFAENAGELRRERERASASESAREALDQAVAAAEAARDAAVEEDERQRQASDTRLQEALSAAEAVRDAAVEEVERQKQAVAASEAQRAEQAQQWEAERSRLLGDAEREHKEALQVARSEAQEGLETAKFEGERALSRSHAELGEVRAQLVAAEQARAASEQSASDERQRGAAEVGALRAELSGAQERVRALEADLASQAEQARVRLEQDRRELEQQLAETKEALGKQLRETEGKQREELAALRRQLEQARAAQVSELADVRKAGEQARADLVSAHQQALVDKDRLHVVRLSEVEETAEQALQDARRALERAQAAEESLEAKQDLLLQANCAAAEREVALKAALDRAQAEGERAEAAERALNQLRSSAAREVQVALENGHIREQELRKDLESSLQAIVELETQLGRAQKKTGEVEAKLARAEKGTVELQALWEKSSAELDQVAVERGALQQQIESLQLELASEQRARLDERNALQSEVDTLIATHDTVERASADERLRLLQQVEEFEQDLEDESALTHLQAAYDALAATREQERVAHARELERVQADVARVAAERRLQSRPVSGVEPTDVEELRRELGWLREDRAARMEAEAESKELLQRARNEVRQLEMALGELRADNRHLRGRAVTAPQLEISTGPTGTAFGIAPPPTSEVVTLPSASERAGTGEVPAERPTKKRRRPDHRAGSGTSYAVSDIQEEVVFRPVSRRPGGKNG